MCVQTQIHSSTVPFWLSVWTSHMTSKKVQSSPTIRTTRRYTAIRGYSSYGLGRQWRPWKRWRQWTWQSPMWGGCGWSHEGVDVDWVFALKDGVLGREHKWLQVSLSTFTHEPPRVAASSSATFARDSMANNTASPFAASFSWAGGPRWWVEDVLDFWEIWLLFNFKNLTSQ